MNTLSLLLILSAAPATPCTDCHKGIEDIQPGCTQAILDRLHSPAVSNQPSAISKKAPSPTGPHDITTSRFTALDDAYCLFCHLPTNTGIDGLVPRFTIRRFSAAPPRLAPRGSRLTSHPPVLRNPSDLRLAPQTCGPCHPDNVSGMSNSPHATTVGQIHVILRSFVGDEIDLPPLTLSDIVRMTPSDLVGTHRVRPPADSDASVIGPIRIGPYRDNPRNDERSVITRSASDDAIPASAAPSGALSHDFTGSRDHGITAELRLRMAFDLIRKTCITCHLGMENRSATTPTGNFRSSGCAACHVIYGADGMRLTADKAMRRAKSPGPLRHQLTVNIPVSQCETCHHGGRVGTAYRGLIPVSGRMLPTDMKTLNVHGETYAQLSPDVHFTAGMVCIDCHTEMELRGKGPEYTLMEQPTTVRCESCHMAAASAPVLVGTDSDPSATAPLRLTHNPSLGFVLHRRLDNLPLPIPQVSANVGTHSHASGSSSGSVSLAHSDKHLETVECTACHTQWSTRCYAACHMSYDADKKSRDLFTGKITPGTWELHRGGVPVNWKYPVFGRRGEKLTLFVPSSQVLYTVKQNGSELLSRQLLTIGIRQSADDGAEGVSASISHSRLPAPASRLPNFSSNPYFPHTIGRETVPCAWCHDSSPTPTALGFGSDIYRNRPEAPREIDFPLNALIRPDGTPTQVTHHPGSRPLTLDEIKKIQEKAACLACHGNGRPPTSPLSLASALRSRDLEAGFLLKHYATGVWNRLARRLATASAQDAS